MQPVTSASTRAGALCRALVVPLLTPHPRHVPPPQDSPLFRAKVVELDGNLERLKDRWAGGLCLWLLLVVHVGAGAGVSCTCPPAATPAAPPVTPKP